MKKKNYVSPTMEELCADEMHLLTKSPNVSGEVHDFEEGEGDPDPGRP